MREGAIAWTFTITQAAETARILKSMGWVPDVVLASNAKRTRQTLDEMTSVIEGLGDDAHLYGSLYTVAALDGQTRQHIEVLSEGRRGGQQGLDRVPAASGFLPPASSPPNPHAPHPGLTPCSMQECLLEVVDDKLNHCVAVVGHNKVREWTCVPEESRVCGVRVPHHSHPRPVQGMEEAASSFAGAAVKLKTASAALLQCVAESWTDVLGTHTAELKKGAKDEDWASHQGVKWELVGVIGPTGA